MKVTPDAAPKDTLAAWQKIVSIRDRAANGEDFAALAKQYSDDPSAKQNGGNLGYFTAMGMYINSKTVHIKPKLATYRSQFAPRFGYHIIKVYDKRPASRVEVSHIFLSGIDDKTKNKAFEVYDQLKGGRNWDDVVNKTMKIRTRGIVVENFYDWLSAIFLPFPNSKQRRCRCRTQATSPIHSSRK